MTQGVLCRAAAALAAVILAAGVSEAAILDFSSLPNGPQGTTVLVLPEATLTTPNGVNFFVGAAGVGDEICALSVNGDCQADIDIAFTGLVSNLFFQTFGFNLGDQVLATVFDGFNNPLGSLLVTSNTVVDMSAYVGVARLLLDDSSTGAGFAYDKFTFDQGAPVPEPTTVALLGLGLAGLRLRRRTKA